MKKTTHQLSLNFDDSSSKERADQHSTSSKPTNKKFQALGSLFNNYQLEDKGGYITQEFQDYGYRLAVELDDVAHKSLYMRLAKSTKRVLLEQAASFVSDAPNVKSKARLFMWKLKQLKEKPAIKQQSSSSPDKTSQ